MNGPAEYKPEELIDWKLVAFEGLLALELVTVHKVGV